MDQVNTSANLSGAFVHAHIRQAFSWCRYQEPIFALVVESVRALSKEVQV